MGVGVRVTITAAPVRESSHNIIHRKRARVLPVDVIVLTGIPCEPDGGPTMLLAAGAGPRNPHAPAHAGRQRRRRRPRSRRSHRRWGIGSFVNAITLIGLILGYVIVGVADMHVPCHRQRNVILGQVQQGIPWAPVIRTPAHTVDHRGRRAIINCLSGTCAYA
jgi:hypothetical protein